jgi:uncharacterized membrane protein
MPDEVSIMDGGWLFAAMDISATVIGAVGVVVIVWGALRAVVKLVHLEWRSLSNKPTGNMRVDLRSHLGYYLLLGLEFLVAADIIKTLRAPSVEHVAMLGGIVLIRTIISVSLNWELRKEKSEGSEWT